MTQDLRHKDLDDAGHAPHAAAGHPEPGKQSLTARATCLRIPLVMRG
jgi:hypothetical protein